MCFVRKVIYLNFDFFKLKKRKKKKGKSLEMVHTILKTNKFFLSITITKLYFKSIINPKKTYFHRPTSDLDAATNGGDSPSNPL